MKRIFIGGVADGKELDVTSCPDDYFKVSSYCDQNYSINAKFDDMIHVDTYRKERIRCNESEWCVMVEVETTMKQAINMLLNRYIRKLTEKG